MTTAALRLLPPLARPRLLPLQLLVMNPSRLVSLLLRLILRIGRVLVAVCILALIFFAIFFLLYNGSALVVPFL
jgi:hypothetical protein